MSSGYRLYPSMQPSSDAQGGRMVLVMALGFGALMAGMWMSPSPPVLPAPGPPALPPTAVSSDPVPRPPEAPVVEPWSAESRSGALAAGMTNEGAAFRRLTCLRDPRASLHSSAELTFTTDLTGPSLLAVAASDLSWSRRWVLEASDASSARFSTTLPNGVALAKTLRLPASGYVLEMDLEAVNPGSVPALADLRVLVPSPAEWAGAGAGQAAALAALLERSDGTVLLKGGPSDPGERLADPLPLRWAGMKGAYLAVLVRPEGEKVPASALSAEGGVPRPCASVALGAWTLEPGGSRKVRILCYAGPLKDTVLASADPALPEILDRGFISTPIKAVLDLLHRLTGNYGVAIILLTLLVRAAIHPLNRMSQISMLTTAEKMKRLQPRLDEVKKRHKSDARKLMAEQTRIMKEEGMTPFSPVMGCLPMLLQLPVLWALYQVLQGAIELRGTPFCLWITDLAIPDSVYTVHFSSPVLLLGSSWSLNPLPIALMVVTVYQMWRAPRPADPQMAQQQKMMMYIMPVMFGFMFYQLPSGITLYWFTSTAFSIGEQAWIRRILAERGIGTGR